MMTDNFCLILLRANQSYKMYLIAQFELSVEVGSSLFQNQEKILRLLVFEYLNFKTIKANGDSYNFAYQVSFFNYIKHS